MGKFKLCFVFDENGDYKPIPYSKMLDGKKRKEEYEDRYFLPFNGYLLEVSHEDYLDYYKSINREAYLRKEAKRVGEVSFQALVVPDDEIFKDMYDDVSEQVISELMIDDLHKAIALLNADDQRLIRMIYFENQTERQCAEVFGIYRNAIHVRKKKILTRLKNFFK